MEYMSALEKEIAMEVTIADIGQKVMSIFKFIGELIRKAIKVLTGLISRLKKTKIQQEGGPVYVDKNGKVIPEDDPNLQAAINCKTNMTPTPDTMKGAGAEVMTKEAPKSTITADLYDCGNELDRVVNDIQFCLEMLIKRPTPDHKVGKGYAERWAGDNEIIADRMAKAAEVLEKLEGIEKKTLTTDKAEKLKTRLETLNGQYEKYCRIYQMFIKKNQHTEAFLATTTNSFNTISNIATKALNIIMQLSGPQG